MSCSFHLFSLMFFIWWDPHCWWPAFCAEQNIRVFSFRGQCIVILRSVFTGWCYLEKFSSFSWLGNKTSRKPHISEAVILNSVQNAVALGLHNAYGCVKDKGIMKSKKAWLSHPTMHGSKHKQIIKWPNAWKEMYTYPQTIHHHIFPSHQWYHFLWAPAHLHS